MSRFVLAVLAAMFCVASPAQAPDVPAPERPVVGARFEFDYVNAGAKAGTAERRTWEESVKEVTDSRVLTTRGNAYSLEGNFLKYGNREYLKPFELVSFPIKVGEKRALKPFSYRLRNGKVIDAREGTVTTGPWETMTIKSGKALRVVRFQAEIPYATDTGWIGEMRYTYLYAPSLARIVQYDLEDWGQGDLWNKWSETLVAFTLPATAGTGK